jgi:hypothetical protein
VGHRLRDRVWQLLLLLLLGYLQRGVVLRGHGKERKQQERDQHEVARLVIGSGDWLRPVPGIGARATIWVRASERGQHDGLGLG